MELETQVLFPGCGWSLAIIPTPRLLSCCYSLQWDAKLRKTNLGKVVGECRSLVQAMTEGGLGEGVCPSEEMGVASMQGRKDWEWKGLEVSPSLRVAWNSSVEVASASFVDLWPHESPVETA